MKRNYNIHKIISMLLAVTLFAAVFTGCGSQPTTPSTQMPSESTVTTAPVTTPPADTSTETEPAVDPAMVPYIGTWILAQVDTNYVEERLEFCEDGTLVYAGALYHWEPTKWGVDAELIEILDPADESYHYPGLELYANEVEDGALALTRLHGGYEGDYFFREDYLQQFEAITLTAENVTEYLEMQYWYAYEVDDFGNTEWVIRNIILQFKEGCGAASWCVGLFTWDVYNADVFFSQNPDAYTMGELVLETSYEDTGSRSVLCYDRESVRYFYNWSDNTGEGIYQCDLTFEVVTGATTVIGVVYVPKN